SAVFSYYASRITLRLDKDGQLVGTANRLTVKLKRSAGIKPMPDPKPLINAAIAEGMQWQGTVQRKSEAAQKMTMLFTEVRDDGKYLRAIAFPHADPFDVVVFEGTLLLDDVHRNAYSIQLRKKTTGTSKANSLFDIYKGQILMLRVSFDGKKMFGVYYRGADRLKLTRSDPQPKLVKTNREAFSKTIRQLCAPKSRWIGTMKNSSLGAGSKLELLFGNQNADGTSVNVLLRVPGVRQGDVFCAGTFHLKDVSVNGYCIEVTKKSGGLNHTKATIFSRYKDQKVYIGLSPDGKQLFGYVYGRKEKFSLRRADATNNKPPSRKKP
ncbi:MAG: hypothetical protein IID45_04085, partial [Planctomycetes bacterium]|nr:hypothetical protein [Planctomycetota bacterium]